MTLENSKDEIYTKKKVASMDIRTRDLSPKHSAYSRAATL